MKAYSQFLKELPSKKVVFAFGRFQPPTIGHELLVRAVEKLAATHGAAHIIYASRSQDKSKNPLPVDRKVYYLKRMFPEANFMAAGPTTRTFIEVAKELNKKYKDIIMVAGSDRVGEYKRILEQYNGKEFHFDTVQVISAGERDPDSDDASGMSGTKMRDAAKKGNFAVFKKGLPSTLTTADGRRLMNEIRHGHGLDPIKEEIKLAKDWLRESYYRGEIFKVGQFVESGGENYEILDRGSNYLTLVDSTGNTCRKWIRDVTSLSEDYYPASNPDNDSQITYKGYTTTNFDKDEQVQAAFARLINLPDKDPVAILNAIKATDIYLGIHTKAKDEDKISEEDIKTFSDNLERAQEYLIKLLDIQHHSDYINTTVHEVQFIIAQYHEGGNDDAFGESLQTFKDLIEMKFNPSDKLKVARIIADALGIVDVEKSSSADQLMNNALRKIRNKPMRPEYIAILKNMLQTAKEAGINYDEKLLPQAMHEAKAKEGNYGGDYQDMVKRVGERAKQGPMKTVWVPHKYGSGGRYKVVPVDHKEVKEEIVDEGVKQTLRKFVPGYAKREIDKKMDAGKFGKSDADKDANFHRYAKIQDKLKNEEVEIDESMTDSWKKVQSMDKGSITGGKEDVKKHLAYLNAVHDHHKKFGNDTKAVKDKIERINRSRIAEDTKQKDEIASSDYKPVPAGKRDVKARKSTIVFDQVKEQAYEKPELGYTSTGKMTYDAIKRFLGDPATLDDTQNDPQHASNLAQRYKHHRMHEEEEFPEFQEPSDEEFESDLQGLTDVEHIIDAYDDDELAIVDDDSGEELDVSDYVEDEGEATVKEDRVVILEISRMERIRRKQRFARTKSKREVRSAIALRRTSNMATINKRSRRLAISMLKKRMLRKDPSAATTQEKERVEKFVSTRKGLVDRLARRVAPRVRQIEKARLQHKKFTK